VGREAGKAGPAVGGECGVAGNWYAEQPNNAASLSLRGCFGWNLGPSRMELWKDGQVGLQNTSVAVLLMCPRLQDIHFYMIGPRNLASPFRMGSVMLNRAEEWHGHLLSITMLFINPGRPFTH
jgi:hypothetical protein